MNTRLVPKFIPINWNITIGELLLLLPILVLGIQGYHYSFVAPNVETSGNFASYVIFLTYATANKSNSVFSFMFGIPFERMIPFHYVASVASLVVTAFHIYTSFRFTDDSGFANEKLLPFLVDGSTNTSGSIATLGMALLVASSALRVVRKFVYQMWLILHIAAAIAVLVGLVMHDVETTVFIAIWWLLDLVVRYAIQAPCTNMNTAELRLIANAESHEPAVELSMDKTFDYSAGQFVRIAIPSISLFEFHPISISSAPHEDKVTLHVRNLGDWTDKLVKLAASKQSATVLVEGPYGAPSVDYDNDRHYQWFLFIGGGIGITPCQSIGKNILHQAEKENRKVHGMKFVWALRNMSMVEDIPPLGLTEASEIAEVDIYCTRNTELQSDESALPYNVHMGSRPDLRAIFSEMKASASMRGQANVAVIACGPTKLMKDVAELCRQFSPAVIGCDNGGVYFDLHKEHFEF